VLLCFLCLHPQDSRCPESWTGVCGPPTLSPLYFIVTVVWPWRGCGENSKLPSNSSSLTFPQLIQGSSHPDPVGTSSPHLSPKGHPLLGVCEHGSTAT
jgi:hypothetical protein